MVLDDALIRDADRAAYQARNGTKSIDLRAAILVAQRPRAEVLAIVRQNAVAAFAQA